MAATVIAAFAEFLSNQVNLDPGDTATARAGLAWLLGQIDGFPERHADFPLLYAEKNIAFGSFARRTKVRPLDDVDVIVGLHATGAMYGGDSHDDIHLTVPEGSRLRDYCHDDGVLLNSRKVVNRFVRALEDVPQYGKAEINRRSEAATLKLVSYDWNFDIVPAFFTKPDLSSETYYLIPNGSGHWKKTDPRLDRDRVTRVNTRHRGNMLNVLRAIKYWQKRPTMPSMPSYLLECIVVNHFEGAFATASEYVDLELPGALRSVADAVLDPVSDPKGIAADINTLSWPERTAIRERALLDATRAEQAREHERRGEIRASFDVWRQVFGDQFPRHG